MPLNQHRITELLKSKFGFQEAPGADAWYELELPGLPPIKTFRSRSKKESKWLEGQMAKQVRVRAPFFRQMLACTKTKEQYYDQVAKDPFPPWDVLL